MQCRGRSTLELSLKNEQLILHTAWARAIKAMVEQFLSELRKASVSAGLCCLAPPGLSLSHSSRYSWVTQWEAAQAGK